MGQHAEQMAQAWGISRQKQDQWAVASHHKAAQAYAAGFFDDLVVPYHGVARDNNLREDTSLEKLDALPPAFDRTSGKGTLTPGKSTPCPDAAAGVLLAG